MPSRRLVRRMAAGLLLALPAWTADAGASVSAGADAALGTARALVEAGRPEGGDRPAARPGPPDPNFCSWPERRRSPPAGGRFPPRPEALLGEAERL
jgi:hypothetical protein